MTIRLGVLALLEAKPDKASELGAFLEQGRAIAQEEPATVTWYAFKISETSYGIFDTFETDDGRRAHLDGAIPEPSPKRAQSCWPENPKFESWTSSPSSSPGHADSDRSTATTRSTELRAPDHDADRWLTTQLGCLGRARRRANPRLHR